MDPNANVEEQRSLAAGILKLVDEHLDDIEDDELAEDVNLEFVYKVGRLAELVQALDGWLSKGGFLPASWARGK